MKLLELCELYFGSKDLYEILKISRQASQQDVRKAYHKLSLSCHPDRVEEAKKLEATEKFKLISKIHTVLNDPEKRTVYDEMGICDYEEDTGASQERDWMAYWRSMFKQITIEDIKKYEQEYKGSEEEREDLKKTYLKCEGDMDKMFEYILFSTFEDEARIRGICQNLIDNLEVPAYEAFTDEPQGKRNRRMRKLEKEAKEAEKEAKKIKEKEDSSLEDLKQAILVKRQESTDSFLSALEKKYAGPKMSENTRRKSSSKGKK